MPADELRRRQSQQPGVPPSWRKLTLASACMQVAALATDSKTNKEEAEQMLGAVAEREKALRRDQADLQEARERLQREHATLVQVRGALHGERGV